MEIRSNSKTPILAGLTLAAVAAAACGGDYPVDDEEQAGQAMINTGGGTLGYTCTTTIGGTTCTCDPMQGDDNHPDTCAGMLEHCHAKGADITCTYPVGKPAQCTCSYGKRQVFTGRIYSGGASSAAP